MDGNGDGIGDLDGLAKRLDYLEQLGVDCIWLLPICTSPRRDDGYDISDYRAIGPEYGSLEDFTRLIEDIHRRRMRIIMDLVVNHTSDQHPWFQSARADPESPYRDYYVWSKDDRRFRDARIIFNDSESSNWAWDEQAQEFYWHRFFSCQPDLNYDNPKVRAEMLDIIRFWLEQGIDGLRVDAVPYLFEREGTNCENLPETHAYFKEMRRFVERNYPGRLLLCEANQLPKDVVAYLGDGDEFQMAFHFPLMPKIFMALKQGLRAPIVEALGDTPAIPSGCQWGTFLRNHDELTLEMVTPQEREWMWQHYAPEANMRLNLGIRRRLAPLLDNDPAKIRLAYDILFSLPGSQFLYYGDEIGMGDDLSLPDRDGVRTPMQWEDAPNGGFSTVKGKELQVISDPEYAPARVNAQRASQDGNSLWSHVHLLIRLRKGEAALQGRRLSLLNVSDERLLAFMRTRGSASLIFLHNLSAEQVVFPAGLAPGEEAAYLDLLNQEKEPIHPNSGREVLQPYQSCWLKLIAR